MSKWRALRAGLIKLGPQIATGIGIGLALLAGIKAVEKTPEAIKLIEKKKEEEHKDELTPMETVEATWKCYILPIVSCGLTIGFMVWSHKIQGRKLVALASAYALTNKSYKEYKQKAKELLSKKKFDEIEHAIDQDKVANYTVLDGDILATNCGDVLCVDAWSGQKFFSNAEAIREAVARCNNMMVGSVYLSLNTLYDEIGNLPPTKAGEELGWNALFDNPITVHFSSVLDKEKIPALVMHLDPDPRPMYQDC